MLEYREVIKKEKKIIKENYFLIFGFTIKKYERKSTIFMKWLNK